MAPTDGRFARREWRCDCRRDTRHKIHDTVVFGCTAWYSLTSTPASTITSTAAIVFHTQSQSDSVICNSVCCLLIIDNNKKPSCR